MNIDFVFDAFASALSFLYDLTSSYGLSIMLLTLGVMILVTPLTLKSTRSMISMQQMQPEIRKLQNKYKDDRQKLNEEMMAFYKEHDISPLGGCLPLIIQTPIFIVLYQVLVGLTRFQPYGHDMGVAAGLLVRDPSSGGDYPNFGTFDPKYLDHSSSLYQNLSVSRTMDFLGLDLADSFMEVLRSGLVGALPYLLLVGVVGVSAWYQQRQIMARNAGNTQNPINPQQQMIMKVMPFFLPFFSLTLPAGIVLYFVVSNLYRIGQQHFITRTMYSETAKAEREAAFEARLKKGGNGDGAKGGSAKSGSAKGGAAKGGSSKGGAAKAGAAKGGQAKAGAAKGGSSKGGSTSSKSGRARAASSNGAKGGGARPAKGKGVPDDEAVPAPKMGRGRARDRVELAKADADDVEGTDGADGGEGAPANGRSPSRQAPSRTAPAQNRSKSKRKRR